jgi:hypothetical protein
MGPTVRFRPGGLRAGKRIAAHEEREVVNEGKGSLIRFGFLFLCGTLMLPVYAAAQSTHLPRNINPGGPMIPADQDPFHLCY